MQRYSTFRPTGFDAAGLRLGDGEDDRSDWLVGPCGRNRDSGVWDESNWEAMLALLGGESDDVEVHRFGHWACGWFEICLIRPESAAATAAEKIEERLENYPLLDEDDASNREFEEACEAWTGLGTKERIAILARHRLSIFAARRDEIPQGLPYYDDFYLP